MMNSLALRLEKSLVPILGRRYHTRSATHLLAAPSSAVSVGRNHLLQPLILMKLPACPRRRSVDGGPSDVCPTPTSTNIRFFTSSKRRPKPQLPPPPKFDYKFDYHHTLKTLQGIHQYVKDNLSLDLWTVNLLLVGFVAGPYIYNAMKNSPHTQDDYMFSIPVDDPVEHSVRILMELNEESPSSSSSDEESFLKSAFKNPEEDAKRILNDLLASEHLRTTASRIASGVIQSDPFQNACKVLVRNIWNDLVNDPETNNQLVALVQAVLKNDKVYAAVKDMMVTLVNDEEVYQELTKLVVQLGEEKEVLDATQRLLTESTHKTLNDPSVLDHSMEFATEVVGDDVVQRSGGEALRNTLGYAVQPSSEAVLAGLGTMIVAGLLHFYFFRGGRSSYIDEIMSPRPSFDSLSVSDAGRNRSFDSDAGGKNVIYKVCQSTWQIISKSVYFPVVLFGSICNGIKTVISLPQQAFSYSSEKVQSCAGYILSMPNNLRTKLASISSCISSSVQASIASICTYVSETSIANLGSWFMKHISHTSKLTKGATSHISSVSKRFAKHGVKIITQLVASIRIKWDESISDKSSPLM